MNVNTNDYDLFDICALTVLYGFTVCAVILMDLPKETACCVVGAITVVIVLACLLGWGKGMSEIDCTLSAIYVILLVYTIAQGVVQILTWPLVTCCCVSLLLSWAFVLSLSVMLRKTAK